MSKTEIQSEALTPQLRLRFAATQHLALCKKFGAEGFKLDLPQDAVQEIISLLDRAERLDAENKALRADAERYRWLRDEGRFNDFRVEQEKNGWMKTHSRATLDAAIDAALADQAAAKTGDAA